MIAPAWRWVRSLVFVVQMYLAMALLALVFTPWAILDRAGAFAGIRTYSRYVRWSARWMVGLTSEIRGPVPVDEVMIDKDVVAGTKEPVRVYAKKEKEKAGDAA